MIVFKYHKKPPKSLDQIIEEGLKNAPELKGFTIRELAKITGTPWPTTRFQFENLELGNYFRDEIRRAEAFYINKQKNKDHYI